MAPFLLFRVLLGAVSDEQFTPALPKRAPHTLTNLLHAEPIESIHNPQVRLARSLLEGAGRRKHGAFLVEGLRLVEAAAQGATPLLVLHTERFGAADARERRLLRRLHELGVQVRPVSGRILSYVTDTVTPQGIVAIVPLPEDAAPASTVRGGATTLTLVLDEVADPGNAGTLLRSAAGAGVSDVLASAGTVDLFSPKVVRAGAGAHFALTLRRGFAMPDLRGALPAGCQVLVADAQAPTPYWDVDWTKAAALVVGNEAHGVSDEARRQATQMVGIPMQSVESLNVGVAASVMLFEALRQRRAAGHALPAKQWESGLPAGGRRVRASSLTRPHPLRG